MTTLLGNIGVFILIGIFIARGREMLALCRDGQAKTLNSKLWGWMIAAGLLLFINGLAAGSFIISVSAFSMAAFAVFARLLYLFYGLRLCEYPDLDDVYGPQQENGSDAVYGPLPDDYPPPRGPDMPPKNSQKAESINAPQPTKNGGTPMQKHGKKCQCEDCLDLPNPWLNINMKKPEKKTEPVKTDQARESDQTDKNNEKPS